MKTTLNILIIVIILFCYQSCKNSVQPAKVLVDEWVEITDTISIEIHNCHSYPMAWWSNDSVSSFVLDTNRNHYQDSIDGFSFYKKMDYFINDTNNYYMELLNSEYPKCKIEPINLDTLTLLGMFLRGAGSKPQIIKKIFKNEFQKAIRYEITVKQIDFDSKSPSDMNWMLIPKISNDYQIQYIRKLIRKEFK